MNEFYLYLGFIFVIGTCIGSFLNVVALRGLTGESIVLPPSKCPVCKNKLKWWMNIPIISYILIGGKCHYCKTGISLQYPIVELLGGIFFVLIFLNFQFSYQTIFYIIAFCLLLVMSVCDIKESVILDYHAYILVITGLLYSLVDNGLNGLIWGVLGAISGFILYEILARIGYIFAGQRAFGEGDSLIAAGIGAFFGYKMMLVSIILSVLIMAIFTLPYFFLHSYKIGKKRTCIALLVSIFLIVLCFIVSKFQLIETFLSSIIFLTFVIVSIFWSVKQILNEMKMKDENGEETMCALPFGPAMAISFILIMFFKIQLIQIFKPIFLLFL